MLAPGLGALARHAPELALQVIDIADFNSEAARQAGLRQVPHLKIYGPDGTLLAEGGQATRWLEEHYGFVEPSSMRCLGVPHGD
jgi:hypothetical protein